MYYFASFGSARQACCIYNTKPNSIHWLNKHSSVSPTIELVQRNPLPPTKERHKACVLHAFHSWAVNALFSCPYWGWGTASPNSVTQPTAAKPEPEPGTNGRGAYNSSAVESKEASPAPCTDTVPHTSMHRKTGFDTSWLSEKEYSSWLYKTDIGKVWCKDKLNVQLSNNIYFSFSWF